MKINGKNLAWAVIQLIFFIGFLSVDTDIDFTEPFFSVLGYLLVYFGILFILGWRFIENTKLAFEGRN